MTGMLSRRGLMAAAIGTGCAAAIPGAVQAAVPAEPVNEGKINDINGSQQWITIRGRDRRNPVLLWLHGGPGIAMSNQAPLFADWERDYTLVQWDQPGG